MKTPEIYLEPKARNTKIIELLEKLYPNAKTALNYNSPLEILVATMLSAQTTDVRVNIVTQTLFKKYHTAKDYADADIKELETDIHSTGFYHNKAKNLKACCQLLVEKFHGQVPKTMEELIELPGVARKTANIVLYNAYGVTAGIAVDTHVMRLSQRLGLTRGEGPEQDRTRPHGDNAKREMDATHRFADFPWQTGLHSKETQMRHLCTQQNLPLSLLFRLALAIYTAHQLSFLLRTNFYGKH